MIINELLPKMSVEDLARRYRGSFVRYDNQIVLINDFESSTRFSIHTEKGIFHREFDCRKLDISRPAPQWFDCSGHAYYINYLWNRQWHRGFCANNTVIRSAAGGNKLRWPSLILFDILEAAHKETPRQIFNTTDEVIQKVKDKGHLIMSPQLFIRHAGVGEYTVFFRELPIGQLGRVVGTFAQELGELIGDYKNVNDVPVVPVPKRPAKKARVQDEMDNLLEGIIADRGAGPEALRAIAARVQRAQQRVVEDDPF